MDHHDFLIFDCETLDGYIDFLEQSTHNEVQTYLTDIGFECPGMSIYNATDDTITNEQVFDYLLSMQTVVQIDEVIMRSTDNSDFLLTMAPENLNSESWANFIENMMEKR